MLACMAKKPKHSKNPPTPPAHRVAVFLNDETYYAVKGKAIEAQKERKKGHASMAGYIESLIARDIAKGVSAA